MKYILALDQGTTSSRAIIFDESGRIVAMSQKEFEQFFPKPGWVEHNPAEIWSSQMSVCTEALGKAELRPRDIAAAGITNQRETTVVWDRATGEAICNAIVWQDRRTAEHCDRLRSDGLEKTFTEKTGLVLDAYFSGTKLAWILNNVPGARTKAEAGELAFGTIDTWLAYNLTSHEQHITDVSNASRTLLFNIHDKCWDKELLSILDIPEQILPAVEPSSKVYGEINTSLGLSGVPLASLIGDQQAATMGQLCLSPGSAKCTYGTGCFLLLNTGSTAKHSQNKLLSTIGWTLEKETSYMLEGSVFVGGAVVQWLRDGLQLVEDSAEIEHLAKTVDSSDGVYLVPALTGLGAPHWDPYACGSIFGLTRGTNRGHLARAALEGIAFQVADLVSCMESDAGESLSELRVDGGAAANDLLLQFQADILQAPVVRPTCIETTALGAAYLAGLAVDYWKSTEELQSNWQIEKTFTPSIGGDEASALRAGWEEAVKRSLGWQQAANAN